MHAASENVLYLILGKKKFGLCSPSWCAIAPKYLGPLNGQHCHFGASVVVCLIWVTRINPKKPLSSLLLLYVSKILWLRERDMSAKNSYRCSRVRNLYAECENL